jgi:TorA maturation chaperone TorD
MSNPQSSMPSPPASAPPAADDQARADLYALCARLLRAPPDAALLAALADAGPIVAAGEFALEEAWLRLTQCAADIDAPAAAAEFALLFGAGGTPLVQPRASAYVTGAPGAADAEDDLGAVCAAMGVLIAGAPGIERRTLAAQKQFFEARVRPWYAACLADIAEIAEIADAAPADFYRAVAGLLDAFLSIEAQAFAVLDMDPLAV